MEKATGAFGREDDDLLPGGAIGGSAISRVSSAAITDQRPLDGLLRPR